MPRCPTVFDGSGDDARARAQTLMNRERNVPARRSLLDRPQLLGVLPTLWFWNSWDAQRLLLPFVLFLLPISLMINLLQVYWGLPAWMSLAAGISLCFLMMGWIERYVRRQARMRAAAISADLPQRIIGPGRSGSTLMLSMAGVAGALTLMLLLEASFVVLVATAGVAVLLMAITARQGARRRGLPEASPSPSLPEATPGERTRD